ncbi:Uncharacterized protein SCF082_LOCUS39572 [Durusdinium trenchii]|uniref:Uncharacterized protein n=1 Tax=Durusdinium trenchii TaxID=1381693 RepID=A0ABP0Q8P9_9DINO
MAPKNASRCTPSFEALASLARTLCEEQNKEAAPSRTSAPKSKPVKKDPPPRRVTGKGPGDASSAAGKLQRGKSKVISMEELIAAGEFDPSNLPFQLTWKNFNKLKAHLQLTEQETTSILLATVGPSPEGKAFWQKYKVENKKSPEETAVEPKAEVEDSSKKRAVVGGETASKADPPQQKRLRRMEHVEVDDAPPGDVTIDLGYSSGTEFGDDSLDGEEEDDDDAMALLWDAAAALVEPTQPVEPTKKPIDEAGELAKDQLQKSLLKANDGSDSAELAAAKRGEAAASRPAQAAAQPAALQVSKGTEAVPPEPKPEEPEPAEPAEPAEAAEPGAEVDVVDPLLTGVVNSSTHRKEHARLARRMANVDAAKFPEMSRLWAGNRVSVRPLEEKSDLLRSWIASKENMDATECSLIVSKKQASEVETGRELLTIREMVAKGFSETKITAILKKNEPVPDADAPDDPESTRFWCFVGGKYTDKETCTVEGVANVSVKPHAAGVAALMDSSTMPLLSASKPASGAGISIRSLAGIVDKATESQTGGGGGGGNEKNGKVKKTKKAAAKEVPQTAKDKRDTARKELKKEMNNCNVIFELPKDHELRAVVNAHKRTLESVGTVSDDAMTELFDEASEAVDSCRLARAQARAVVAEIRKAFSFSGNAIPQGKVSALISEGYLEALVDDVRELPRYWRGDEINALNDSWMYVIWTSDASPFLTNSMSSRFPIAVLPAARYAISDQGINLTLDALTTQIVASFNRLANTGVKIRDATSLHRRTVSKLWFYVCGFRGDWKAMREAFHFTRDYSRDEICWLCLARKGNESDMTYAFCNASEHADFWSTYMVADPWAISPPYAQLVGFSTDQIMPDLLHVVNLGVGRDLLGSILHILIKGNHAFVASNIDERLAAATVSLRAFAKSHALPLRLKKLTRKKLNWGTEKYAELRLGSGYDNYVVSLWLEATLEPHSGEFPKFCSLLWSLNTALHVLYTAGWFLSQEQLLQVRTLGSVFVRVYLGLASEAIAANNWVWRMRPKFHLLHHVFFSRRCVNSGEFAIWMDEDYLKKASRTLRVTSLSTAQGRFLERWLLALPESLRKSMGH